MPKKIYIHCSLIEDCMYIYIYMFDLYLEVKHMYTLLKYNTTNPKMEAYQDAWHLRRLYTFAFKRQHDAEQRGQRPRDWGRVGGGNVFLNVHHNVQ